MARPEFYMISHSSMDYSMIRQNFLPKSILDIQKKIVNRNINLEYTNAYINLEYTNTYIKLIGFCLKTNQKQYFVH